MKGSRTDWEGEFRGWLQPFLDRLGHKARRRMCPLYIAGLIGPGDSKSIGPMAERLAPVATIVCIISLRMGSGTPDRSRRTSRSG